MAGARRIGQACGTFGGTKLPGHKGGRGAGSVCCTLYVPFYRGPRPGLFHESGQVVAARCDQRYKPPGCPATTPAYACIILRFQKRKTGHQCTMSQGIRAIDVVVAFGLRHADDSSHGRPVPWLAEALGVSSRTPFESLARLRDLRLIRPSDLSMTGPAMAELLIAGARYMFPAAAGPIRGGVPTASSAQPLVNAFPGSEGELAYVWPSAEGSMRGASIEPLHRAVPGLALRNPEFHADLALIDALRLTEPRLHREAARLLRERIRE